jgi:glucose-6-phosphate isomerase
LYYLYIFKTIRSKNPAGTGYPELYEVIEGVAHVLPRKKTLDHIALIKATNGDIVLIPPRYGHVTTNPSWDETLLMANLVSTAFVSEFTLYEIR